MQTVQYRLPTHWAVALVNGDETAFSDGEQMEFDAFCESMAASYGSYYCVDVSEDEEFSWFHDAEQFGVLACMVADYSFDVTERA